MMTVGEGAGAGALGQRDTDVREIETMKGTGTAETGVIEAA